MTKFLCRLLGHNRRLSSSKTWIYCSRCDDFIERVG